MKTFFTILFLVMTTACNILLSWYFYDGFLVIGKMPRTDAIIMGIVCFSIVEFFILVTAFFKHTECCKACGRPYKHSTKGGRYKCFNCGK